MIDQYGYIAFGPDDLFHYGAVFGALRVLGYSPNAHVKVLTDRPDIFDRYPVEVLELSEKQKAEMSFGNRYHFGIKAAGVVELLKGCDRLFFMDTDMYLTGDISEVFDQITPTHSIMRMCEGAQRDDYGKLAGAGISLAGETLTGKELMWNSGVLGVHRSNILALESAYAALGQMREIVSAHTIEQFCVGVALSQGGRTISPHRLPIRHYSTGGKKRVARAKLTKFFAENSNLDLNTQIEAALRLRLRRTPLELVLQPA